MNQYITAGRLKMVCAKYWFENKRALVLLFGAVGAFLIIWMSLYYSFGAPNLFRPVYQVGYYFLGLFISGLLSASFLFSDLRNKPRAIALLMIPASQLEKVIVVMFFGVLVFWMGYSIVFSCIDWVFVNLSNARSRRTDEVINILTIYKYDNPFLDGPTSGLYYLYFAVHALFALGSVYFSRYAFFKTLLIFLIFWLVFFSVPIILLQFLPPGVWVGSLTTYEVFDHRENIILTIPSWFGLPLYLFFCFGICAMLWLAAFFRFNEKQIA
jgi:hypothetical protein